MNRHELDVATIDHIIDGIVNETYTFGQGAEFIKGFDSARAFIAFDLWCQTHSGDDTESLQSKERELYEACGIAPDASWSK